MPVTEQTPYRHAHEQLGEAVPDVQPRRNRKVAPVQQATAICEPDRTYKPWGMLAAIDVHGCDSAPLADPHNIEAFVGALVEAIGMRAHGPLHLERFGDGELEGWSAMQFIETSSITMHADEVWGRCFVDVFSCRPFDAEVAAAVATEHFGGTAALHVLRR